MPDLLTRIKFHPNQRDLSGSGKHCPGLGSRRNPDLTEEWFYLLNGSPRASLLPGQPRVFESPLHASDWLGSNLPGSSFQQGMALTFSLPFPGSTRHDQLSCIPTDSASKQKYIDFMVKEIQLLAGLIAGGADIPYLHWSGDLISNLSPAELTQLVFHIDRSFKIFRQKDPRLVFELNQSPDSADQIALLAGLGFNTACVNEPGESVDGSTTELLECIGLLKSFNIANIYVRVKVKNNSQSVIRLLTSLIDINPAGILISKKNAQSTDNILRNLFSEADYLPVRTNFFVHKDIPEHKTIQCLKGIGLGAVSYIESFQIHNTNTLDNYYSQLSMGQLPIQSVAELHFKI